jgi:hypothetical protein
MRRYPNLFVFSSLLTIIACSASDPAAPSSGGSGGSANPTGGAPVNPTAGTPTFGGTPPAGGSKGTAGTMTGSGGTTPGGGGTGSGGVPNTGGTPQGTSGAPTSGSGGAADGPITGYFTSGTWKGFAWTATFGTGNTVMPANFAGVENWPVCASGTVKADEKGGNGAMVGWNLNQERAKDSPLGTITPSKAGINVSITAKAQSQLRLQIQAADGETNAAHRWCAEIGTGGANIFVPYESFNTECWPGGKGAAYDKSVPLTQAIVQIPSGKADVPFDFCIDSITEADGAGMAGMGCDLNSATSGSPLSGSLPASNKLARVATNTGSPVINVQNNIFGSGGQYDISYNGPSFTITNFTGSAPTNGAPMGYPSLFIGSAGGDGQATTGSNLAKQVSALTDIPTAWRWSGMGTEFNVAYDVWFAPGAGDAGQGSRSFLMVWFHKTPNVFAEGEGEGHSGGVFTVGGKSFNTYVSQQFEGRPIISYVATNINEWSFDLNDFITDAKTRTSTAQPTPVINNNLYLTNVFAGFEVWSGVSNLKTDKFCIQVK